MNESKLHELKVYPQYFNQIIAENKTFEIRQNDRCFKVGDKVLLKEWDNIEYSGRSIFAEITYILDDKFIGLSEGYVAFSIEILDSIKRIN